MLRLRLITRWPALLLAAGLLVSARPGGAVVTQIDGTVVPQDTDRILPGLNFGEGEPAYTVEILNIDPVRDAKQTPELFQVPGDPDSGFAEVDFEYLIHGGGYDNDFGWYNADDPSELFIMMGPNSGDPDWELENDWDGYNPWTQGTATRTFDFGASYEDWLAGEPGYHGGAIGFFLYTEESEDGVRRLFYTEQELNGDGNYVHFLIYESVALDLTYYFGFEDLFRGGDNDFEDNFFQVRGLVVPCVPEEETCDGQDNNCNGYVDENLVADPSTEQCEPEANQGICGAHTECREGEWQCIVDQGPTTEICNGFDDDCDGQVDDSPSTSDRTEQCTSAQNEGACAASTQCTGGAWRCVVTQGPVAEICDGVDNDCNGETDEGLAPTTELCTVAETRGECEASTQCTSDGWACVVAQGPVLEICDGLDNDCDGTVDDLPEGAEPDEELCSAAANVGPCEAATECTGGAWRCVVSRAPEVEVCDGIDNDCDGTVDDDLVPPADLDCFTQNVGQCVYGPQCDGSGGWACVRQVEPTTEICDGLDNDCNGTIDDLPTDVTIPNACGAAANAGDCSAVTQCSGGAWRCVVEQGPNPEVCDGRDNDCNGAIDDNMVPPTSLDCVALSVGTCSYQPSCDGTTWECAQIVGPVAEICDGRDNDCDGQIDEEPETLPGVGGECTPSVAGLPICGTPSYECLNGVLICTNYTVGAAEICDQVDNDCDGAIDENLDENGHTLPGVGLSCGTSVGECEAGLTACVDGELTCAPEQGPIDEVCDGRDNDCDGQVDEDPLTLPGVGDACEVNACTGQRVCENGALVCSVEPQPEECDGLDNDCDGSIDEDLPWVGTICTTDLTATVSDNGNAGECASGHWECLTEDGVAERTCVGEVGPVDELCNGLDDDCDGYIDNDPDGDGPEELHGEIDGEDVYVRTECGNEEACGTGSYVCEDGAIRCDTTIEATAEVCNGRDDDCDGEIDEAEDLVDSTGAPCGTALPPCTPGVYECLDGELACVGAEEGEDEICDGADNDCDGLVDEDVFPEEGEQCAPLGLDDEPLELPLPEDSLCQPGTVNCLDGGFVCVGAIGPNDVELCNLVDDNCNGLVDDDAVCPPEHICREGQCLLPCLTGEFPCPGGTICVDGYCEPIDQQSSGGGGAGGNGADLDTAGAGAELMAGAPGGLVAGAAGHSAGEACAASCQARAEECDEEISSLGKRCRALCAGTAGDEGEDEEAESCLEKAACDKLTRALRADGEVCGLRRGEQSGEAGAGGEPSPGESGSPAAAPAAGRGAGHAPPVGNWGMATGGGGCGCKLGSAPSGAAGLSLGTALLGLLWQRRRRSRVRSERNSVRKEDAR